jgi:hypothetical protein
MLVWPPAAAAAQPVLGGLAGGGHLGFGRVQGAGVTGSWWQQWLHQSTSGAATARLAAAINTSVVRCEVVARMATALMQEQEQVASNCLCVGVPGYGGRAGTGPGRVDGWLGYSRWR